MANRENLKLFTADLYKHILATKPVFEGVDEKPYDTKKVDALVKNFLKSLQYTDNIMVKFAKVSTKTKSDVDKRTCTFKVVNRKDKNTKDCGKIIKNSMQQFCDAHERANMAQPPEVYLASKIPSEMLHQKCVKVTPIVAKALKGVDPLWKASNVRVELFLIRSVLQGVDSFMISYFDPVDNWSHGLVACLRSEDETLQWVTDTDLLTKATNAIHIPLFDKPEGVTLMKGLSGIKNFLTVKDGITEVVKK